MQTQEVIEGWRGVMVSVGLKTPMSRALTAGIASGAVAYAMKWPANTFRSDGSMRPHSSLSPAPDATAQHFILTPLVVASAVYLFT
jgi:hypothetical protein